MQVTRKTNFLDSQLVISEQQIGIIFDNTHTTQEKEKHSEFVARLDYGIIQNLLS